MTEPKEFLEKAARHLQAARDATDPAVKASNLDLAQSYHRLFDVALRNRDMPVPATAAPGAVRSGSQPDLPESASS